MTTMENPQPDTSDPGNELTAEAAEHAEIFSDAPDTENSHLERAYQLQREEDFETALQECAQAIEDVPTLAEAHNLRGLLLEQLDRPEQALEAYRRAAELDAEFEEARQNLQELQEELREASYRRTRVSPLKVILTGAAVYGVLCAIANRIFLLEFNAMPLICVIGLGTFIIGKTAKFKQALWLSIVSGLGFGVAYIITDAVDTVEIWMLTRPESLRSIEFFSYETFRQYSIITGLLQYAIIGAVTGLGFGLVQKTRRQIVLSMIAGIAGFSLYSLLTSTYTELIWIMWLSSKIAKDSVYLYIIGRIFLFVEFFVAGGIIGALFGYVLTRYRPPALEISDLDEATTTTFTERKMTTMENPQPDTSDPGNELTAEAAEIFPNAPDAENSHLERAYQLQREEDFETALQECAKAIEDVPTLAEAHNLRGLLLEQLDRPEQALEAYRRAVEVDAEFEEARQNLRELQEELQEASRPQIRLDLIMISAGVYGILYILSFYGMLFLNNIEGLRIVLFQARPLSGFLARPLLYGPEACAIGVGAFIIGKVARFKQALWLGVASGLGYLVACSFTGVEAHGLSLLAILQYAFIGALTGLGFGLVQRTKPQLISSILAGIIGFSLQNLLASLYPKFLWVTGLNRFFAEGALIGAAFGYVLTLYRSPALEASDIEDTSAALHDTP